MRIETPSFSSFFFLSLSASFSFLFPSKSYPGCLAPFFLRPLLISRLHAFSSVYLHLPLELLLCKNVAGGSYYLLNLLLGEEPTLILPRQVTAQPLALLLFFLSFFSFSSSHLVYCSCFKRSLSRALDLLSASSCRTSGARRDTYPREE